MGDVAYPGGVAADLDPKYFDVYRDVIAGAVFYVALGNKDVELDDGAAILEAFCLPENSPEPERSYSFVHGNASFIALDSNGDLSPGSSQLDWLAKQLAAAKSLWKFVYFHHPIYTSGRADTTLRSSLEPLFREHPVDVVFQAHNHFYERTFPLAGGNTTDEGEEPSYVDPEGTVYIVSGGGGGTLITATPKAFSARYKSTYHCTVVDVEDNVLRLSAVDRAGAVIDSMTITKTVAPPPPLFHRGDADASGVLELTDAIRVLGFLFLGTAAPGCFEAADADDNGEVQLTDAVRVLNFLFAGGPPPSPPGPPPEPCGPDPQGSAALGCVEYAGC
jgi:hypothetical protein